MSGSSASYSDTDTPPLRHNKNSQENTAIHVQATQPSHYPLHQSEQMEFFVAEQQNPRPIWETSNESRLNAPPEILESGPPHCVDHDNLEHTNNEEDYSQFEDFDWNVFRASRIDWLGSLSELSDRQTLPPEDLPSENLPFENLPTSTDVRQAGVGAISSMDRAMAPTFAVPDMDRPYKANQTSIDIPSILAPDPQGTWPEILDHGGNETWPFDYASNKGFRRIKLPPLRQVLEQTVGDRPAIEKTTLMDLIKILSAPHIPLLNDSPTPEALPAVAFLGQFMKVFFAEFHAVLPIIHLPSWRIEKCPTALLAAMACIGAIYSTAEGSPDVATLLAEITQRALFWMVCMTFCTVAR